MPQIQLRDYQSNLVRLVRSECAKGHKRILMVLPTGGGKTYIAADIAKRAVEKGHKVLCLMHRRHLVNQMLDRFSDYGLDPGVIMSGDKPNLSAKVQVATIQTYSRRIELDHPIANPFFIDASVVIIDEAHRSLSKTYQDTLKKYEGKIIIGVTATPCLSSGVGMGEYYDSIVDSVGVQELIDSGSLVPARYYAPSKPDLDGIRTVMGDYEKKSLGKTMNTPKLIGDVFDNWLNIAGDRQTIVFAVNVKHSKALCREFKSRGVKAEHLDAHSDDDERAEVLKRLFDGDTQVVFNVGLYTEGFDYPGAECIVLARPTKSMGLYRQMAGRGLRPFENKSECIIIDHGGCIDMLGFVEDDVEWTLDGKKSAYKKKVVREKEKHIMTCDMCSASFTGKRCPRCGTEVPEYGKKIAAMDAKLVEIKGGKKKKLTTSEKKLWYQMFSYEQRRLGKTKGWLLAQYKSKTGVWPRNVDNLPPVEPSVECKNWLTSQRIKWIKGRQKGSYANRH